MLYEATLLSAEQDERTVLDRFAALVVPMFADWCVVFAAAPDGSLTRSAVAAADRDDLELLEHVRRRWPDPGPDHPAVEVARTGTPVLLRSITGDALARLASDTERRRLLEDMGPRSILILPLEGASERLGAVAFVSTLTARYTDADLAFGTALAARLTNALIRARRRAR